MTPAIRGILARAYGYARGAEKRLGEPTEAERAAAAAAGYPLDETVSYTHDEAIARLRVVVPRLSVEAIAGAFIAGVGGSAPRGLQPLISYAFARHLPPHAATGEREHCEVCSIDKRAEVDRSEELVRCHLGFLWNELPTDWVLDLEELAAIGAPRPTADDRATFVALLAAIAEAPADCTPGQLEKERARARWDRFAENAERHAAAAKLRSSPRSDIVLPFGGWRGALGVSWTRADELFGVSRPRGRTGRTPVARGRSTRAPARRSRA